MQNGARGSGNELPSIEDLASLSYKDPAPVRGIEGGAVFVRDEVLLSGVGIGGYRSMPTMRYFGPLGKVSLLAGQNNVGKSNVIRFLQRFLVSQPPVRSRSDEPQPSGDRMRFSMAYRLDHDALSNWFGPNANARTNVMNFLALPAFHPTGDPDLFWVERAQGDTPPYQGGDTPSSPWLLSPDFKRQLIREGEERAFPMTRLRDDLFDTTGGDAAGNVEAIIDAVFPFRDLPPIRVINAFRKVAGGVETDDSGGNLIITLAEHQNPDSQARHLRTKFNEINRFVRDVLEDPTIEIEIPYARNTIQVEQNNLVFPLEDLGTGIQQVVIIAAAATLLDNTLVCIEEPEVNLHPVLQRKLVRYLSENTTNQYLIATHSAHMLDYERANVIHLRKTDEGTIPAPATLTQHVADLCADLGYRPSDVLQANAVIWVEGPSDRTYLRHWLRLLHHDSPFIEGIHFSIMFYGGALLSHLTGEDPADNDEITEFISLRRMNRHSMILIDSDRSAADDNLNDTKNRVIAEFNRDDMPGHAWVTEGRTIENYVPADLLNAAVETVHPRTRHHFDGSNFGQPLATETAAGEKKTLHKVKIATEVTTLWTDPSTFTDELHEQVRAVEAFIARANG